MDNKEAYLHALESAIVIEHRCKSAHLETVPVAEKTEDGQTLWSGNVEVFGLTGHAKAKKCFAWVHVPDNGKIKIFAVLENQLIDSAKKAVQAGMFIDSQAPSRTFSKQTELFQRRLQESKEIMHKTQIKMVDLDAYIQSVTEAQSKIQQMRKPLDSAT